MIFLASPVIKSPPRTSQPHICYTQALNEDFPLLNIPFQPILTFTEVKSFVGMKHEERSHHGGDFWEVLLSSIIEIQREKPVFLGSAGAAMLNHIWIHSTRLLKYHHGAYWHISMKTPWPH